MCLFISHNEHVSAGKPSSWFPQVSVGCARCLSVRMQPEPVSLCSGSRAGNETAQKLSMELDYCSHIHSYYLKTVSDLVQHSNLDSLTSDWSCSLIVCQGGANKPHDCGHRAQFSSQGAPQVKVKRNTPVPLGKQHKFVTELI